MFNDLTELIQQQLKNKPHVVVGISGFAGGGKSTLANKLRDNFGIKDGQIVRLDNIYAPEPRGDGLFDDYNWSVLKQILDDAHAGKPLHYNGRGFKNETYVFNELLPTVVIVEGIRLFRPELRRYFDVSVWVNCPPELALQRAKARDLSQGADEDTMKRWDVEWGPKNQKYFDNYHPDQLASFVYEEYM